MKEVLVITGASGSVAKALHERLKNDFIIRFLTREKKHENEYLWDVKKQTIEDRVFENVSHIIHLAGANISDGKWTAERKKEIMSSRIDSAKLIFNTLQRRNKNIKSFISASAAGIYGAKTSERIYSEKDEKGNDFLSDVVKQWEKSADHFAEQGIAQRVIKVRTGIILSSNEGALSKMVVPVKYGVGSPIGSGKQYIPWIHMDDICGIYEFLLKNKTLQGAYNAAAPQPTTNKILMQSTAKVLGKPFFMPNVPSFVMKLVFGELAIVLLEGSRISSDKIISDGYYFKFPELKGALEDLLLDD